MSETGDPALIGRRVAGKFLIEKFLGGGAMGAVYRAKDTTLDRHVGLKVMHPTVAIDPNFVSRFHREARAASRLDHPNSMRVIEFGAEPDGLLYIAMEYLEGRDLYKVIHEDWPLSNERIGDVMMKALSAITMAHEMGVIHRDLKPENIMILNRKDDEGADIVKVCDFGIAKITESDDGDGAPKTAGAKLTTAGLVVGTPEYMSPEQARGEKLDARSDLYSMGIILYQLLTGRTPFLADTALAVVLKHISEPPAPPRTIFPGVHQALETVCLRALAKTREERYQSARDMRAAVRAAIEGRPLPVEVHAPTTVDPASGGTTHGPSSSMPPARRAGTSPMSSPPSAMVGAVASTGGGMAKITPLGTALATADERRSRAPVVLMVAAIALVVGAGVFIIGRGQGYLGKSNPPTATPTITAAPNDKNEKNDKSDKSERSDSKPPPSSSSAAPNDSTPSPLLQADAGTRSSRPGTGQTRANGATNHATSGIPTTAEATPSPSPPAPPEAPPAPPLGSATASPLSPTPPPLSPTPAPAPPPPTPTPPAAFNSATCKAALGAPKSASGYNANNVSLHGTDSAWAQCARTSIKDKPAAPISATVHLRFNDNRAFKGASCPGCPAALSACIASSTARTVSVSFKSGDATGDPEFDVPVTFSCD